MDRTQLSDAEVTTMVDAFLSGATLGDLAQISQEDLEAGYTLAHSLYSAGNYKDAEVMFKGLCLYDHTDERFWLGLGGCRQMNGNFSGAIDAYGMGSTASALKNPVPIVHAAICYLKMGDKENASALFTVAANMKHEGNEGEVYINKAKAMLAMLKESAKHE